MSFVKKLLVKPKSKVHLGKFDPDFTADFKNEEDAKDKLDKYKKQLRELQFHMYAENKQSLLVCLQGLDAAGKDGTVNHVFSSMNPQGTKVHGFKVPSHEEASHDFLWRIHQQTPATGNVTIFNRSQYEDVLVTRVHKLVPKSVWSERYELINDFEKNLVARGTRILKFYLHISQDEQLKRFAERLDDPSKNWKISESDYSERKLWPDYIDAFEECLSKTSTKHAPWYVIPANNKWFRDVAIAKIVKDTMENMDMKLPAPTVDIDDIKKKYLSATRSAKKLKKEIRKVEK